MALTSNCILPSIVISVVNDDALTVFCPFLVDNEGNAKKLRVVYKSHLILPDFELIHMHKLPHNEVLLLPRLLRHGGQQIKECFISRIVFQELCKAIINNEL